MAYILEKIGNTYNLPKKYFTCDAKSDLDGISLIDVPIGSEAYCILEEESYILDSNKQWHKKKIGEDLTGQVQADLSQTDSTQADYVKGVIRQESLPEGYPYKEQGWVASGIQNQVFRFREENGRFLSGFPGAFFVVGDAYKITWDGTDYICTAFEIQGTICIGNATAVGGSGNDEPFLMMAGGSSTTISALVGGVEHTISLSILSEVIHPMSEEFLPELTSPNGTKYKLTVSDDGTLSAVAVS